MTDEEALHLKKIIFITAEYYGKTLSKEVLQMRASDLTDLPLNSVRAAYENYRRNPKHKFDPLPAQIREIVLPQLDPGTESKEAASRALESISKYGYMRGEEAKIYMGPLAWKVIERFGGWSHLCQNVGVNISESTLFAQMRDVAMAVIERHRLGLGDTPPQLEAPRGEGLTKIGDVIKQALPPGKDLK